MRKLPRWLPWAAAAVVGLIGWQVVKLHLHHDWARAQQIKDLQRARAGFADHQRVVDTAYVHDTVTFIRYRTHLDTLLVDRRITDTVWVKNFIQVADSTVLACSEALQTCGARVAIRDSMIANLVDQLRLEKKSHPGWLSRTATKVTYFGIGFGAAKILSR